MVEIARYGEFMVTFFIMESFLQQVQATPGGRHILACIQCGTCTGTCPVAGRMEYPVRRTIAMIRAGMEAEVLGSDSMWYCLSCYLCSHRCPKGVKPTELAHALESLATRKGYEVKGPTPAMYRSFVDSVRQFGRVYEIGMLVGYYLKTNPLAALKLAPVGLKLVGHRRLAFKPHRIKGQADLKKVLQKFRQVRGSK
ncbi:4Fe-4S dicluster domain-containing protein [Chloroflexota bacterium]